MEPILSKSPVSYYFDNFLDKDLADICFTELNNLSGWKINDYNGFKLNRQTVVFADSNILENPDKFPIPNIWGKEVTVIKWPETIRRVKSLVEEKTGVKYNIALGNRYIRAKDAIAFHSDNEEFGNTQSIASISLGVPRLFTFKSKTVGSIVSEMNKLESVDLSLSSPEKDIPPSPESYSLILNHGSLLFMGENCQENYTHGMKRESIIEHPFYGKTRINVTFRIWNY